MNIEQAKEILSKEFGFTADFTNGIIKDLGLKKDSMILDVGTGSGNMAIVFALNGYKVITGEPETDDSVYAKQDWLGNARKAGIDHLIEFKNFNAENMPFEDHSFGAVFMLGSLHHIDEQNRVRVLQECMRILKPNSVICILEPNQKGLKAVREKNPSHPDAADPCEYAKALHLEVVKKNGEFFDAFILIKLEKNKQDEIESRHSRAGWNPESMDLI